MGPLGFEYLSAKAIRETTVKLKAQDERSTKEEAIF
jgi:hypothetical protein